MKEIFTIDEYNLLIEAIYDLKYKEGDEITEEQEKSINEIIEKLQLIC